jgi:hypothetical protein
MVLDPILRAYCCIYPVAGSNPPPARSAASVQLGASPASLQAHHMNGRYLEPLLPVQNLQVVDYV